jgi:hypothetical protein
MMPRLHRRYSIPKKDTPMTNQVITGPALVAEQPHDTLAQTLAAALTTEMLALELALTMLELGAELLLANANWL